MQIELREERNLNIEGQGCGEEKVIGVALVLNFLPVAPSVYYQVLIRRLIFVLRRSQIETRNASKQESE